jgi:hypothetical protein
LVLSRKKAFYVKYVHVLCTFTDCKETIHSLYIVDPLATATSFETDDGARFCVVHEEWSSWPTADVGERTLEVSEVDRR